MAAQIRSPRKMLSNRTVIVFVIGMTAIGLAAMGGSLFYRHLFPLQAVSGTIPSTKPIQQTRTGNTDKTSTQPTNQAANSPDQKLDTSTVSTTLVAPFGSFVSNHHPSLSSSATANEQSFCSTTIDASCTITFSMGAVTKTLTDQTVGSSGATSWSWNLGQAGFVPGTWKITATATLNGQTKSTDDSLGLVVGQ